MITGAHAILYSTDPDADRAFLRDVLAFPHVDAGGGWLIFALPPAEVAIHPGDQDDRHELYLMTDDVATLVTALEARGVAASPIADRGWGLLTQVTLPGGGALGVYEPRHPRPHPHVAPGERSVHLPNRTSHEGFTAIRPSPGGQRMPWKTTKERAARDKREGKAATTQAGEYVREEMEHVKRGKHGVKSRKQAIAIGLSKARRSGVKIPRRGKSSSGGRRSASSRSTAKKSGTKTRRSRSGGRSRSSR